MLFRISFSDNSIWIFVVSAMKSSRTRAQRYLIKNSQAVKKGAAPKKAMLKKDVKSKMAAKKWL